jgi:hypothetical protein
VQGKRARATQAEKQTGETVRPSLNFADGTRLCRSCRSARSLVVACSIAVNKGVPAWFRPRMRLRTTVVRARDCPPVAPYSCAFDEGGLGTYPSGIERCAASLLCKRSSSVLWDVAPNLR